MVRQPHRTPLILYTRVFSSPNELSTNIVNNNNIGTNTVGVIIEGYSSIGFGAFYGSGLTRVSIYSSTITALNNTNTDATTRIPTQTGSSLLSFYSSGQVTITIMGP